MSLKKLISLITVVCIVISLSLPAFATKTVSISEKAKTLNKIDILQGNGNDFNLEGKLLRGEAATFIVRLMGMEKSVLAEKDKWSKTNFKDIKKSDWYAPYIGYCSQIGIINGYPDGYYKPNESISEKAFLKLVLGVLGYKYNIDFTWSDVCTKAYDTGLVYDYTYQSKVADDTKYKRGSVVEVLYNSLNRRNKDTGVKILDNLIEKDVVDRFIAVAEGLINDPVTTSISSVTSMDMNTLKVKFNESIKALAGSNIKVFETKNESSALSITINSQSSDELILKTVSQVPDKEYSIRVSDVTDKDGNVIDVEGTFTGYKLVEVNSDFFKIKKIEAISKNVINVFFTQPINMNAEMPTYFEILQGDSSYIKGGFQTISSKVLAPYDNAITIFCKEKEFLDGASYILKISGELFSVYGAKLNNGSGDKMGFVAKASANEGFHITNVYAVNKKYVKIQFSKDININNAQVNINYTIKNSDGIPGFISKAVVTKEGVYKNKEVTLLVPSLMEANKVYELTVKNLTDSFDQMKLSESDIYKFAGVSEDPKALSIENVSPQDKGTLVVYFNRPLNELTATDCFRYTLMGVTEPSFSVIPSSVYYDSVLNPYMVKLYIPGDSAATPSTYKLKVDALMQDYMGETTGEINYTFNGSGSDNCKPYMEEALIISDDMIRVKLNEEITSNYPNTMASNYVLEYQEGSNTARKNAVSVSYVNAKMLILKFDKLDLSKQYTLKFTDRLVDYSGGNARLSSDNSNGISVYVGN